MNDPLQQTASAVDNLGRAGLATLYGGVRIDEQAGAVDVLLTDLSPVVQAQLAKAVPHPETLHLMQGRYRLTELEALQHQIDSDWSRLASEGIHISSTGIGFGLVNVTVAESDPNIATVLHARYGDAIVVVLGQAVRTTATQTREGHHRRAPDDHSITAGHCFGEDSPSTTTQQAPDGF